MVDFGPIDLQVVRDCLLVFRLFVSGVYTGFHDYGDLCQAVTELAHEKEAAITVDEFHTFNRCLDNAIADAVTEFGLQRDQIRTEERAASMNERLGNLAHELRNRLSSGMLAFQAIKVLS